jgi:hypothetical protein
MLSDFASRLVRGPLRICFAVAGFRSAMEIVSPSVLPRLFIERALGLIFFLAVAWAGAVAIDLIAIRWHSRLDPRVNQSCSPYRFLL